MGMRGLNLIPAAQGGHGGFWERGSPEKGRGGAHLWGSKEKEKKRLTKGVIEADKKLLPSRREGGSPLQLGGEGDPSLNWEEFLFHRRGVGIFLLERNAAREV